MAQSRRNEVMVGAFLLFGLALLGYLIFQFGKLESRFRQTYPLEVDFKEASGVIKGSAVRLGGTKIGEVAKTPELTADARALVTLAIDDEVRIQKESVFQISTSGFLGDKVIVITPPEHPNGAYLEQGVRLQGGGPSGLELIQDQAVTIAQDTRQLMKRAREALQKTEEALEEVRVLSRRFDHTLTLINEEVLSAKNRQHFSSTLEQLDEAAQGFARLPRQVEPVLAEVDKTLGELRGVAQTADGAFTQAREEMRRLQPTLEAMPEVAQKVGGAAAEAEETLRGLRRKEGLLGSLMQDGEAKENAETFLRNLREHGILGYRDEEALKKPENDPRRHHRGRRR